jgi:hypothetical protein
LPKFPLEPTAITVPSAAAYIGVPVMFAISIPLWAWVIRFSPNSEVILPWEGQIEGIEGFAESSGIIYSSGSNSAVGSIKGRISTRAKYHCLCFSSKSSVTSSSERTVNSGVVCLITEGRFFPS